MLWVEYRLALPSSCEHLLDLNEPQEGHDNFQEVMSMEHTRAEELYLIPKIGDRLLTNHRRPILTIVEVDCNGLQILQSSLTIGSHPHCGQRANQNL